MQNDGPLCQHKKILKEKGTHRTSSSIGVFVNIYSEMNFKTCFAVNEIEIYTSFKIKIMKDDTSPS